MLIDDVVREVLVAHLGLDRAGLVGPARLADDLGLDSLGLTEALLALEDELAISIPDLVQAELGTFDDLLAVVASQARTRLSPSIPGQPPRQAPASRRLVRKG